MGAVLFFPDFKSYQISLFFRPKYAVIQLVRVNIYTKQYTIKTKYHNASHKILKNQSISDSFCHRPMGWHTKLSVNEF